MKNKPPKKEELLIPLSDFIETLVYFLYLFAPSREAHELRVAKLALDIGRDLGLSAEDLLELEYGAKLHDMGNLFLNKVIIDRAVQLTESEVVHMRMHPVLGKQSLKNIQGLENIKEVISCHQEHYDGSGYPEGLKGKTIPLNARIVTICDVWDALISRRSYKPSMTYKEALFEMSQCAQWFDPELFAVFLNIIKKNQA